MGPEEWHLRNARRTVHESRVRYTQFLWVPLDWWNTLNGKQGWAFDDILSIREFCMIECAQGRERGRIVMTDDLLHSEMILRVSPRIKRIFL